MSNFAKILNHIDRDQIISRLTSGDSVRTVSAWLKEKYPNNKENQLSFALLDQFRREHLNLSGAILEDLKTEMIKQQQEELNDETKSIIKKNKTYNEKIEEIVDTQLDLDKRLYQFLNIVETRFAQLFDITQNNPNNFKPDRVMIDWFRNILELIKEMRKARGSPDQIIQHNVAIQVVDEQVALIQQAIINTFSELPIDQASKLIDKFNKNLQNLKANQPSMLYNSTNIEKIETILNKALPEGKNGDK